MDQLDREHSRKMKQNAQRPERALSLEQEVVGERPRKRHERKGGPRNGGDLCKPFMLSQENEDLLPSPKLQMDFPRPRV